MANMNLIGVFVTKLWPVQALACGGGGGGGGDGGDGGDGGGGGATKTIISPKFSNFGDIIICQITLRFTLRGSKFKKKSPDPQLIYTRFARNSLRSYM